MLPTNANARVLLSVFGVDMPVMYAKSIVEPVKESQIMDNANVDALPISPVLTAINVIQITAKMVLLKAYCLMVVTIVSVEVSGLEPNVMIVPLITQVIPVLAVGLVPQMAIAHPVSVQL